MTFVYAREETIAMEKLGNLDDGMLNHQPQRENIWHTKVAEDYDFRDDLKKINFADEDRIGNEL